MLSTVRDAWPIVDTATSKGTHQHHAEHGDGGDGLRGLGHHDGRANEQAERLRHQLRQHNARPVGEEGARRPPAADTVWSQMPP